MFNLPRVAEQSENRNEISTMSAGDTGETHGRAGPWRLKQRHSVQCCEDKVGLVGVEERPGDEKECGGDQRNNDSMVESTAR